MQKITENIYYVGVNDRNKSLFEGLWPLPNGVSYNSYLIDDEKVCLIDTVEVDFFTQYLEHIHEVIGDRKVDYLVINHMEPDHSGSIALVKKYYPDIQIVGNKKTFQMMEGFYGINEGTVEVKNGDSIALGKLTLNFVLTPMVHWPETMVTLCGTVLFSGDAFGCFGALNGGVIDEQINCDTFWLEMVRYYSNIVGKYGTPVQNALKKLADVKLDYICATHGPVWHQYIDKVIGEYDRMSKYETEPGLVICYGTMYGNTERAAEVIARAASEAGVKNIVGEVPDVSLHAISHWCPSPLISDKPLGACQPAGRGLRPRARHTHQLAAGATAETGPAVVCVPQPAPAGVLGSVQPQPYPGAAHGPGPGPCGLPVRPRGPGPAATPRSSHPPGMTAPLTVGGRQAVRPCQPCSLPPALLPPARCPP